MGKILLVEDDNSLREIFEMRLQAEGFQTVTAGDGEEGLAVALREKPDLVIADVMMPKLSGFDMLEQIRNAPELKNTKAIMMTALGQAEDQARGQSLGVVKYLVKSQATLEDFTRVVKDVMGPESPNNNATSQNNQGRENNMQEDNAPTNPMGDSQAPTTPPTNPVSGDSGQMSTADEKDLVNNQANDAMGGNMGGDAPAAPAAPAPTAPDMGGDSGSSFAPSTPPVSDPSAPSGDGTVAPEATPPADDQNPPAPAV